MIPDIIIAAEGPRLIYHAITARARVWFDSHGLLDPLNLREDFAPFVSQELLESGLEVRYR